MVTARKHVVSLYVDRTSGRWIVRDDEGNLWLLSPGEAPWDNREPFCADEETELEPVPGHYKYMLGLPF